MTTAVVEDTILNDINYDRENGKLYWNKSGSGRKLHKSIGTTTKQGYLQTTIKGVQLKVHHIVWFIETGKWPLEQIDHKDKDKSNNRFLNLREGNSVNQHNRSIRVGKSGLPGAYKVNKKKPWRSTIKINGKTKSLGLFNTKEEANAAYMKVKESILK